MSCERDQLSSWSPPKTHKHTHAVDPGGWWKIAGSHKPIYHVSCLFILHEKRKKNIKTFRLSQSYLPHTWLPTSRTLLRRTVVVELSWLNDWNIRRIIKGDLWCISAEFYSFGGWAWKSFVAFERRRRRWGLRATMEMATCERIFSLKAKHAPQSPKHLITHLSSGKLLSRQKRKGIFHHQRRTHRPINRRFSFCVFMLRISEPSCLRWDRWSVIHNMKAANVAFNPL